MESLGLISQPPIASKSRLAVCLLFAPFRSIISLWLYFLASVSAPAAIGMPAERYAMTVEPLLYLLGTLLAFALCSSRLRKRDIFIKSFKAKVY